MSVEWREVKSNPNYIVSSDGQVGSRKFGKFRMLKPGRSSSGYLQVVLCDEGVMRSVKVHQLVAAAFLPPKPTPKHQINHKNGVKADNRDANFEWVTSSENVQHGFDILGHKGVRGNAVGRAKLTEVDVREIRRRCAAGERQRIIAADYGITQTHVSLIARGKTWAWLK